LSRSSFLFILLAFAFGLWLGFNPEAHAKTAQTWKEVKTAFVESVDKLSKGTSQPVTTPNTSAPNTDRSSKSNNILNQLSAVLHDLWEAFKILWRDLMNKLPGTKS